MTLLCLFPPQLPSAHGVPLTVSVPAEDADDAREYLKHKTSLMPDDATAARPADETSVPQESLADVGQEILERRRQHEVAACNSHQFI